MITLCAHCLTLALAHSLYSQLCVRCGEMELRLEEKLQQREQGERVTGWAEGVGRVAHGEPPELERQWEIR